MVGRCALACDKPASLWSAVRTEDAIARERCLKSGMGKRYLKNRLEDYLAGLKLSGVGENHRLDVAPNKKSGFRSQPLDPGFD